jgi:uncharacterized OB-fold protein
MAQESTKPRYCLPAGLPVPDPSRAASYHRGFWEAARRHELAVQRCRSCGAFQFAPEEICHQCRGFDLGWERVSGRGKLFSWSRVSHPVHPALKDGCPYIIALVELPDAGSVRMIGNLVGDAARDPAMDAEVEAVFEDHEEGYTLVQWRLAQEPAA